MAIGKTLLWDESTEDFMIMDGGLVLAEGELSVAEWLSCNIGVEENRLPIYEETGIGVPLPELIGAKGSVPINTIMAVLSTRIEETALLCQGVDAVNNVSITRNGSTAHISLSATTTEGEELEEEADIDL